MKKYLSKALKVIHHDAEGLHRLGIINDAEMQEFDEDWLAQEPETDKETEKSTKKDHHKKGSYWSLIWSLIFYKKKADPIVADTHAVVVQSSGIFGNFSQSIFLFLSSLCFIQRMNI